jgi:tetratricopeptide (TPR) repeat protein
MIAVVVSLFLGALVVLAIDHFKNSQATSHLTREEMLAWRHFERGEAYSRDGRYFDAIESYSSAIDLIRISLFYNNRGCARLNLRHHLSARKDFFEAKELDPGSPEIRTNLGIAYYLNNEAEKALAEWQESVRLGQTETQELIARYTSISEEGQQMLPIPDISESVAAGLRRLKYLNQDPVRSSGIAD